MSCIASSIIFPLTSLMQGDLIYLNAAGQPILVLNSQKVAADLLDRRAANYSGRARNFVAADILAGGLLMVFNQHSDM